MAKAPNTPGIDALRDAVDNLRRDLTDLQQQNEDLQARVAQVQAECTGAPRVPAHWRERLLEHYVWRVTDVPGVAAVAAWPEGDGMVLATLMEGYDHHAEYDKIIDHEIEAYNALCDIPIDFQIRSPGPELEEVISSWEPYLIWKRG
jgi:hypothetical protein